VRHWLVRPELMCRQHLSGEHLECHMFLGSIEGQRTLNGYYSNGLFFGPKFLMIRHKELKPFILHHKTRLVVPKIYRTIRSRINGEEILWYPDRAPTEEQMWLSWHTLMSRCKRCRKKHLRAKREGHPFRYSLDPRILRLGSGVSSNNRESRSNS
jgi:hypothetical protein